MSLDGLDRLNVMQEFQASLKNKHIGTPVQCVQRCSVVISVSPDDPTICTAVFDRTVSSKRLVIDFRAAIRKLDPAPPYREVDPRIFEAVRLLRQEKLTYEQASVQVFGSGNQAENIRYWDNWYRQAKQNEIQEAKA